MEVGASGQVNQVQNQMQMRKMDGTGGGHSKGGNGGMRDIMQSLPQEDKMALQEQMKGMSSEDRKAAIESMKQVDSTPLSGADYTQALLDAIGTTTQDDEQSSTEVFTPTYA